MVDIPILRLCSWLMCLLAVTASPRCLAQEEGRRYRVHVDGLGLPDIHLDDATRSVSLLRGDSGQFSPHTGAFDTGPLPPDGQSSPVSDHEAWASLVELTPPSLAPAGPGADGSELLEPGTDPDQAFRDRLAQIYEITDDQDVRAIWSLFQREPTQIGAESIGDPERTGNAVIKYSIAQAQADPPRAIGDADLGQVTQLATQSGSTALRVNTPPGVTMRTQPWGTGGMALPNGTEVTVEAPPDESGWVRVVGGAQDGYVNAIWLAP